MPTSDRRAAVVVFAMAAAVMVLEIALTRVFSFITYHHMTYLVIAVAMLGFGAAGTFLTIRGVTAAGESRRQVARHAALFGAATVAALIAFPHIRFYAMDMYNLGDPRNLVTLLLLIVTAAVPFFFGGVCIAALLSNAGPAVNRIYFADLVGSACGSLAAIELVNGLGAVATCVVAAALGLGAAALMGHGRARLLFAVSAMGVVVGAPLSERVQFMQLHVPPGKQLFGSEASIETTRWHVITRLDVGRPMDCACSFGGALSQKYVGPAPQARLVFQDGSNLTGIIRPTPTPRETPVFGYFIQGAPYVVRPSAEALVIGSGGGVDVMVGLHHGASHLVAVDVNPKTMALVRGEYANFAGHVFERPDVEPVVSEGRHFLSRDGRKYDVIQLSGVDTWAAQASGAYALTENFVYTAEAFDEYLRHLRPGGMLGFSRPFVDPPLETLRLMATALDALDRAGASNPSAHLLVISGLGQAAQVPWAEMLVARDPFTERELDTLGRWAAERGFSIAYDPRFEGGTPLDAMGRSDAPQRRALMAAYPLDVHPVTDDAPFYFQYHHWHDLVGEPPLGLPPPMAMWVLAASLVEVLVLSGLLILYPLYRRRSAARGQGKRASVFLYFASLGLGFIFVEMSLLQKLGVFLGGPAYALSITMFTLLSSSGLGSFLSDRAAAEPLRLMGKATPVLVALIGLEALVLDAAMRAALGLSLPSRAAVAVLLVAPLGLVMGALFPAGMRHLEETRPGLKPWAWGINACATVVGTTICMLLVSAWGFRAALLAGAAVYAAGWLVLAASERAIAHDPAPAMEQTP